MLNIFSFLNVLLSIGVIAVSILQFRETKRYFYLGLLIPCLYLLGVYIGYFIHFDHPMTFQVWIRISITLLLLSLLTLIGSDLIAVRIIKNGNNHES